MKKDSPFLLMLIVLVLVGLVILLLAQPPTFRPGYREIHGVPTSVGVASSGYNAPHHAA